MHRDAAFETSGKAYTVFEAEGAAGEIANPGHKRYSRVLRMTSPVDRAFMSPGDEELFSPPLEQSLQSQQGRVDTAEWGKRKPRPKSVPGFGSLGREGVTSPVKGKRAEDRLRPLSEDLSGAGDLGEVLRQGETYRR